MRAASGSLKGQLALVSADEVYEMTDDMQELLDQNNDIQEALSRTYETPEVQPLSTRLLLLFKTCFEKQQNRDLTTTLWSRS
jgi:hypothetical protein